MPGACCCSSKALSSWALAEDEGPGIAVVFWSPASWANEAISEPQGLWRESLGFGDGHQPEIGRAHSERKNEPKERITRERKQQAFLSNFFSSSSVLSKKVGKHSIGYVLHLKIDALVNKELTTLTGAYARHFGRQTHSEEWRKTPEICRKQARQGEGEKQNGNQRWRDYKTCSNS